MSGKQKSEFLQSQDGKLYFKFALGAVYRLTPSFGKPFYYCVSDIEFDNETEYYRIRSAGKELPTRFSVTQLEELLGRLPCALVQEGEYIEVPLLVDEVQEYFKLHRREANKANVESNKILKSTAWFKNLTAIGTLKKSLCLYIAKNEAVKITETEQKLAELENEQSKILEEKGIDIKVLTKAPDCEHCKDTGIIDGQICECAYEIIGQIKRFNAEKRLRCRAS